MEFVYEYYYLCVHGDTDEMVGDLMIIKDHPDLKTIQRVETHTKDVSVFKVQVSAPYEEKFLEYMGYARLK